jgi:hypothetical protein
VALVLAVALSLGVPSAVAVVVWAAADVAVGRWRALVGIPRSMLHATGSGAAGAT